MLSVLTAIAPQLTATTFILIIVILVLPKFVRELGTLVWSFRRRR